VLVVLSRGVEESLCERAEEIHAPSHQITLYVIRHKIDRRLMESFFLVSPISWKKSAFHDNENTATELFPPVFPLV